MNKKTCVIVGAGLAGAATAYHLTRMGLEQVIILEQEFMAGVHSSGRNAAMIRQVVTNQAIAPLALEGAAFLRRLPPDWPILTTVRQNGSFLLSSTKTSLLPSVSREGVALEAEWRPIDEIARQIPLLRGAPALGGIWCPTDGVVDIHSLLQGFLRSATQHGAELRLSSKVMRIIVTGGKVSAVQTQKEEIECDSLVDAGGAWAGDIGQMAGAASIPPGVPR